MKRYGGIWDKNCIPLLFYAAISGLLFNLSPVLGMAFVAFAGGIYPGFNFFGCAVVILENKKRKRPAAETEAFPLSSF